MEHNISNPNTALPQDTPIEESYRDALATMDNSGKRVWVYPKKPDGKYYDYRKLLSYVLLIILFGMPFIKVNGQPFMLFNIIESKFIIFGIYFAPQDFHLFVVAMLIGLLFILLFTVIFGRLFCGWICPQTLFMEMVFRRIEYWIEGDANAQRKLSKAAWTQDKIIKKGLKHGIFILISIIIAHTFLAYIIGIDDVIAIVLDPISQHWKGFVAMVVFTIVFYGVFSVLREQVCTTICPYGRLQGVLLDENSLAVSYDFVRGEPRGKMKKEKHEHKEGPCKNACANCATKTNPCATTKLANMFSELEPTKQGDCIDCKLCVQVCPTGIDIRNGTQLECINCTACMDACDQVMEKIDRPLKLIRIDSYNGIVKGKSSIWNNRVAAYTLVLVALIGLESFLFINRSDVETLFLRTPGMLYQDNKDGYIGNLYNYQLINKSDREAEVRFVVKNVEGVIFEAVGNQPKTIKNNVSEGAIFIKIPRDKILDRKTKLEIEVYIGEELIDETKTNFLGPG